MKDALSFHYVQSQDARLFTVVCLPEGAQRCPVAVYRTPYVDAAQHLPEEEICAQVQQDFGDFLRYGFGVVYQHCRGRGKSEGDCIPYLNERQDTLALYDWIRRQPFYNGEIYLYGRSYASSVHLVATPFAQDIKGAVLEVQDSERYNCNFRNGFYKIGLHGNWYVNMYKKKSLPVKHYVPESFNMLPLRDFSQTVFNEKAADFDEILQHPSANDPFWRTHTGGEEAHNALVHAHIPILLITGFYDIYTGGIFDMWRSLDAETRAQSALVVSPYDHSGKPDKQPVHFENGMISEHLADYRQKWLAAIRDQQKMPFETGKVTYYKLFDNTWHTDDFAPGQQSMMLPLGEAAKTYRYNPYAPASFKGGLSCNFGGTAYQDPPFQRPDILTVYTQPFAEDTCIKGKMKAQLHVASSCEDTCFYMRLSLCLPDGDLGLRDDIQQISNFDTAYVPGQEITLDFSFDEHAFVIRKGQKLRIDISSSAFPLYVRHTNNRGLSCDQTTARIADNTVFLQQSTLTLPIE
ncbi:MAG: CocE/NonD family hydrolase [Clostridia bacterium]|nr:CocE/NonD family hydrolase [Clostridia bacterium]